MTSPSFLDLYITLVPFMLIQLLLVLFQLQLLSNSNASLSSCMDTEHLVEMFNSACCFTALNAVAPLKRKKCKVSSTPQPWLNTLALSEKSA